MQRITFAFLLILITAFCYSAAGQELKGSPGQALFMQHCSRCHGVKGGGGEGPALNRPVLPRAANDEAFGEVVRWGIAGTSMPGMWHFGQTQISQLIKYVRSLSTIEQEKINGNPQNGKIFIDKSGCFSCHVINGSGASIGPELSSIGLRRGSMYLEEALVHPGKQKNADENGFTLFLVIEVTLADGRTIKGIRTNEDTYTMQLKDSQNKFYSFRKSEAKSIQRFKDGSLMPSYGNLSKAERDDIIAFLMNQK